MTRPAVQDYLDELRGALVSQGLPATEREQVVAEVEAHVRDTGEDPVEAFGPPGVYAAAYAEEPATADPAARRGDGIPGWAKVVLCLLGLLLLPLLAALLVLPVLAVAGGVTGVELVVVLRASAAVGGLVWWAVRRYRSRAGASGFGAWVVGIATLVLAFLALPVLSLALGTTKCARSGVEQGCSGDNPLMPHAAEVSFLVAPVVVLAVGSLVLVSRAAGRRTDGR